MKGGKEVISGGKEIKTMLPVKSPVYRWFELYKNFAGRPSRDQLAILLFPTNFERYFDVISGGHNKVEADGSSKWIEVASGNPSYI